MDQDLHPALTQNHPEAGLAFPAPRIDAGRLYLLIAPHPAVDRLMDALAVRLALAAHAAQSEGVIYQSRSAPDIYLHILDSGNRFDLHGIARGLAAGVSRGGSAGDPPDRPDWTGPAPSVETILQRIRVARAFTCYQAEALLAGVVEFGRGTHEMHPRRGGSVYTQSIQPDQPGPAPTTGSPAPVLVPGLLAPFADENVPRGERLRLFGRCIQHLKRLAGGAPVLVSASPPAGAGMAGAEVASMEAAGGSATGADTAGACTAEFLARLEAAADQVWRFESGGVVGAGLRPAPTGPTTAAQLRMF